MVNSVEGGVKIDAGGEVYVLRFTHNSLCELEDVADCSAVAFVARLEAAAKNGAPDMRDLRLLMWAGLIEARPEMTLKDAGRIIEKMGGVIGAAEKLGRAFAAAMGPADQMPPGGSGAAGAAPGN